jgi:hypothetical protein
MRTANGELGCGVAALTTGPAVAPAVVSGAANSASSLTHQETIRGLLDRRPDPGKLISRNLPSFR